MTEEEQKNGTEVVSEETPVEPAKPKKESQWFPVALPKVMLPRIDAVFEVKGFRSRAQYVKNAVIKQLEADESERRDSGGSESDAVESGDGVQDNTVA